MVDEINEIDLNADMGEGFGSYAFGDDEALLQVVSSANIACGFHAGDARIMRETVERCLMSGVAIGAHPGLPDRLGFGRREMRITPREAADWTMYQVGALEAFVRAAGGKLRHVKPHGALYHMASSDGELAEAIVGAVRSIDGKLLLFGLPNSSLQEAALRLGVGFVAEGFADRAYTANGGLVSRHVPGAMIEEPAESLSQALSLARDGSVRSLDGAPVRLSVRTICVHGDSPQAALRAKLLAEGLREEGVAIRPPSIME